MPTTERLTAAKEGNGLDIVGKALDFASFLKMSILAVLPIVLISVPFISLVFYVTSYVDGKVIKDTLGAIEPWFLLANFLAIAGLTVLNRKTIFGFFKGICWKTWAAVLGVFLLALFLRTMVAPLTHRVLFDEDIYADIGKEILLRGKALLCNNGDAAGCYEYDWMKWPSGFPFLLAAGYAIFGIKETVGYYLTAVLGSLSVPLVFLVSYLLTKNVKVGFFAALVLTLAPVHIMWSSTAATEPVLAFFGLLSFMFVIMSAKAEQKDSFRMLALALAALAFAMQIKVDALMLLPIGVGLILFLDKKPQRKTGDFRFLLVWALFFLAITPYLVHMMYATKTDSWGASGEKISLEFFMKNASENFWWWISGYPAIEHPIIFTVFAAIGIIYAGKKDFRTLASLGTWFMAFFVLYAFFYAGSVRYGADVRYQLSGYPPFSILAGMGLFAVTQIGAKIGGMLGKGKHEDLIVALFEVGLALLLLFSFYLYYLPSVATPSPDIMEAHGARLYHDFALESARKLANGCYILSHVPSIFLTDGESSLQTWNGQNELVMRGLFQKTGCIVFDDGYWCTVPPYQESVCKSMFDKYKLDVLYQTTDSVEQRTFTFYQIEKPAGW
jgi:4-amino-4-deoxy-L-arabinose transferase-like glycosyltransferase